MNATPGGMLARQNTTAGGETFSAEEEAWIQGGGLPDATQEAYARLGRIRDVYRRYRNVILIDMVSRSTGSDSMPGNVTLQIDTAVGLLTALKAAVEGEDENE